MSIIGCIPVIFNDMDNGDTMHICFSVIVAFSISLIMLCIKTPGLYCCAAGFMGAVAFGLGQQYDSSNNTEKKWSWKVFLYNVYGAASGCLVGTLSI